MNGAQGHSYLIDTANPNKRKSHPDPIGLIDKIVTEITKQDISLFEPITQAQEVQIKIGENEFNITANVRQNRSTIDIISRPGQNSITGYRGGAQGKVRKKGSRRDITWKRHEETSGYRLILDRPENGGNQNNRRRNQNNARQRAQVITFFNN